MAAKNEKTVDGVRAVEMYYRVIRDISSGSCAFYQSQTRLNTPGMGTARELPRCGRGHKAVHKPFRA